MSRRKKTSSNSLVYTVKERIRVNRKYKDSVFRMLFSNRDALLSLYNAVNNSNYTEQENLEITTIGDAIYMGYKNDIAFLIDNYMNLYEAQSTQNPNIALRGMIYFSQVYDGYVQQHGFNIYGVKQVKLPTPQYVVLYNGTRNEPERREYRLSDAFIQKQENYCLECVATVYNINAGYNKTLMNNCRLLYEYAQFVALMRLHLKKIPPGNIGPESTLEAVNVAIEECIQNGILVEFLTKHSGEVRKMILTEYDEEKRIKSEKLQSYDEGWRAGKSDGEIEGKISGRKEGAQKLLIRLIITKSKKGFSCGEIADMLEVDTDTVQSVYDLIKTNPELNIDTIYEQLYIEPDKEKCNGIF